MQSYRHRHKNSLGNINLKKIVKQKKPLTTEKAESNHLTASSTWISNQQTRTVETDWQVYCLELIKKPNLKQTTTKKKKLKNIRKYLHLLVRSFASWLKTHLVMTCIKVCVFLPGRAFIDGAVLCKSNQDIVQIQRGNTLLHHVISLAGRSHRLTALQIRSRNRFQHVLSRTGVCYYKLSPQLVTERGSCSLCFSILVLHHKSPITQGGILKQLAVKIGNESLPFSLLEPSFLNHEKD